MHKSYAVSNPIGKGLAVLAYAFFHRCGKEVFITLIEHKAQVDYNGVNKWTVDKAFSSRMALGDIFSKYIPQFEYHLVNTGDYNREELLSREDI